MKVLVACERSGIVRDEFTKRGHDVTSCDLFPSDTPGKHYAGDVRDILYQHWDLMIAHPPCTYLTVTGNKWMLPQYAKRFPTRKQDRQDAIDFFMLLANAPIERIAIENPVGIMATEWRSADQYIHPYFFGDPHSKLTGLWLKNLAKLERTHFDTEPQFVTHANGKRDPLWHYESMRLPKDERARVRSNTFPGIARAMAEQWGEARRVYQLSFEMDYGAVA